MFHIWAGWPRFIKNMQINLGCSVYSCRPVHYFRWNWGCGEFRLVPSPEFYVLHKSRLLLNQIHAASIPQLEKKMYTGICYWHGKGLKLYKIRNICVQSEKQPLLTIWYKYRVGITKKFYQIENLHQLEKIPIFSLRELHCKLKFLYFVVKFAW